MDIIFTQNDILLFIYGEMSPKVHREFVKAMAQNPELKEEYLKVHATIDVLDKVKYQPSPTSINIIMEQSHDSELEIQ